MESAPTPRIRITVDGKLALTVEQAAQRLGVTPSTLRGELSRYAVKPAAVIDGRKNLYLAADLDRMWNQRPGRGSPGKARSR